MAATPVPISLLLQYFAKASEQLEQLHVTDGVPPLHNEEGNVLNWHRNRVVKAQLTALNDTLLEYDGDYDAKNVQDVLRKIGLGDFNDVDGDDDKLHENLVEAMENTNKVAREAFARSVLFLEMRGDTDSNHRHLHTSKDLDRSSLIEYCGLAITAVSLPEVQAFLLDGTRIIEDFNCDVFSTTEERLLYIQRQLWTALGWDRETASDQIKLLIEGKGDLNDDKDLMETVMKYVSSMTVAATNASMGSNMAEYSKSDGTTRVVSVSYTEKVVTSDTIQSLSAPTSNSMKEHTNEQQAFEQHQQLQVAKMRQQIHDEFHSQSAEEQRKTLDQATQAQENFMQQILNTPAGPERVLLMKNIDIETQKLLIIHKMCASTEA
jgi:hypothetical protein